MLALDLRRPRPGAGTPVAVVASILLVSAVSVIAPAPAMADPAHPHRDERSGATTAGTSSPTARSLVPPAVAPRRLPLKEGKDCLLTGYLAEPHLACGMFGRE